MDRKRFDDGQLDGLLAESLGCAERPAPELALAAKRRMRQASRKSPSLWWLPALCGTAVSACVIYALSFVADWKCFTVAMAAAFVFTASAWLLSIIGICKFDSFKEASRLI